MKFFSFFRLFGHGWQNLRTRRKSRQHSVPARRLTERLAVEALEDRTLMSVLPTPLVSNPRTIAGNGVSPMVAIDPVNSQKLVAVYTTGTLIQTLDSTDGGQTWQGLVTNFNLADPQFTERGSYTPFTQASSPTVAFDRNENFYITATEHDATDNSGVLVLQKYAFNAGQPTQTITDNVLSRWFGQDPVLNPVVAIDNNVKTFTDTAPDGTTRTQTDTMVGKAVYVAWNTVDAAPTGANASFNPNTIKLIASGDGGQTFTGQVFANDGLSNPNFTTIINPERDAAPQIVFTQGSADGRVPGGQLSLVWNDFGRGQIVVDTSQPDGGVLATPAAAAAVFTQSSPQSVENGTNTIREPAEAGTDANNNEIPDVPATTTFTQTLNFSDPNFDKVVDLNVSLALFHPHLNQLSIVLSAKDALGNNLGSVSLLNNRTNGLNQNSAAGVADQANMGGIEISSPPNLDFNPVGTVFDQQAPRSITDPGATAPYIAHFRPEQGGLNSGGLNNFNGLTRAQLNGSVWTLAITDHLNDADSNTAAPPVQFLSNWSLNFSAHVNTNSLGTDTVVTSAAPITGAAASGLFPLKPAVSPSLGIGPAPMIASDNTLGSYSPFQGRLYIAYVGAGVGTVFNGPDASGGVPVPAAADNTDVFLVASDTGGTNWNALTDPNTGSHIIRVNNDSPTDGFSQGNRPQFMPSLAVDPVTGTVVVTYLDARYDAARARVVNTITASIDGGQTFSDQTFLNTPKTTYDEVTRQTVTLEPIPGNLPQAGTLGFGDRQGLVVNAGHIIPVFSSNLNTAGSSSILTATTTTAGGPRVVSSDMGPIVNDFTEPNSGTVYNNTFASDGTRQFTGFVVTFDRPVDATTFTTSQVTVTYHNPAVGGAGGDVPMTVSKVTPLDANTLFGPDAVGGIDSTNTPTLATTFLVSVIDPATNMAPSRVGTYSYTVGPNIRDRIRSGPGVIPQAGNAGNFMDQNTNGVTAEPATATSAGDVYAIPLPLNGAAPGMLPYSQDTLPLIVPGPHVISTFVNGNPVTSDNLVLNGTVSNIDVVFDRNMNPNTFTAANVLRMMGPTGLIADTFTVTADPNPGFSRPIDDMTTTAADPDPNHPRTYKISFFKPGTSTPDNLFLSGTYTLTFAPAILDVGGHAVDTNLNAGVDVLRGANPSAQSFTPVAFPSSGASNNVTIPPAPRAGATSRITSTITVNQNFVVQGATVLLNITDPSDPDLTATLVGPDGTTVRLFTNVGNTTSQNQGFQNTVFDDAGTTPIQQGVPPFNQGPYNPQTPLSAFKGHASAGTYTLFIDNVSTTHTGKLLNWQLNLLEAVPTTGLGEPIADQFTAHFRIFTLAPTSPLAHDQWTAVGPASENNGANSGRIGGLALDPSDPSGNTVFVAGASGGVWKTTNFLTNDPQGPTYIPLTDFGPTFSLNIGSIAVFGRNNDPNQSIVFAATGEGDTGSMGVGILRSMDGGATWTLLDSTTNTDSLFVGQGNLTPISSKMRDHIFVGTTSFKILVDPKPSPTGEVIVYLAVSGPNGGIWVSRDTGKHWGALDQFNKPLGQPNLAGNATDVALAAGSADATGNLQKLYGAIRGQGVFFTQNQGQAWTQTADGSAAHPYQGDQTIRDGDYTTPPNVPVQNPSDSPNGAKGRIVLVTPFFTGDPLKDFFYSGWIYAGVVTTSGNLDGLYLSKDFGGNWTKIRLPDLQFNAVGNPPVASASIPSNDTKLPDVNPLGGQPPFPAQGNYDISLAIDPTNANIVYLGGTNDNQPTPQGGLIRVDTTALNDPKKLVAYDNSNNDGGLVQLATTGGIIVKNPGTPGTPKPYGLEDPNTGAKPQVSTPILNLTVDPNNPFLTDATILVSNVLQFTNDGTDAIWTPFNSVLAGTTDQHRVFTFKDPLTGHARLVFGDDQGVFTGVDMGNGTLDMGIGSTPAPTFSRNGNLQIIQFYYGASQPSNLAAEVAGAFFYGMAQDDGFPQSDPNILANGNLNWTGPLGDGTGVATDQTGSGTLYQYKWPCCGGDNTNFFQVTFAGSSPISRVGVPGASLLQPGDSPGANAGEWPFLSQGFADGRVNSNFAVNPIDPNGIVITSATGRVFRSTDQGKSWFVIGQLSAQTADGKPDLDDSYAAAPAFGAPDPKAQPSAINNFIYIGTEKGHVFVTFQGGGFNGSTHWKDITGGTFGTAGALDGSAVQEIVTDPTRGSHDLYAVTQRGVYFMADSSLAAPTWVNITGNVFAITHKPFGNTIVDLTETQLKNLTSIAADWRFAIPDDPTKPNGPNHPVLYVGGEGGVYRSTDKGKTWTAFPNVAADGSNVDGGMLPDAHITQLSIAQGNIDPNTGFGSQPGGPDLLLATTYGRGSFAIRLPNASTFYGKLSVPVSGPRVVSSIPGGPDATSVDTLTVTFGGPVDPTSFDVTKIDSFVGPNNTNLRPQITAVRDITPTPPAGQFNLHNIWEIDFTRQTTSGLYQLVLGPYINDFAGDYMDQNQNGINGENPKDTFTATFFNTTRANFASVPAVFGRDQSTATVIALVPNSKTSATAPFWDQWAPNVTWVDVLAGDFNGDGKTDLAARNLATGQWYVAINNGSSFTQKLWDTWSPAVHYTDVLAGDFNGDGKDDIVGRVVETSPSLKDGVTPVQNVFVSLTKPDGSGGTSTLWDQWSAVGPWLDVRVGDFTGHVNVINGVSHPIDDLVGGILLTGIVATPPDGHPENRTFRDIFVAESTNGSSFVQKYWQSWDSTITWANVVVGNFTNDGKAGLAARVLENGALFMSVDYTPATVRGFGGQKFWQQWSAINWTDVLVGDFDGNGKDDILARDAVSGVVYVSLNFDPTRNYDPAKGGTADPQQDWKVNLQNTSGNTWVDLQVADFTGDGKADFVARVKETGMWYLQTSTGTQFNQALYGAVWSPNGNWVDVRKGII